MFETPQHVISALRRYRDVCDPRTGSIITPGKSPFHPDSDPFHAGFLVGVRERQELTRRMTTRLRERERLLLVLWYMSELPVGQIARRLEVSRVHCYRIRKEAVSSLCDAPAEGDDQ